MSETRDSWNDGDPYEYFMGRWSTLLAPKFLSWLGAKRDMTWLDVGCGTGALSKAILERSAPLRLISIDPSDGFLRKAQQRIQNGEFITGDASNIPIEDNVIDMLVSGLAINFIPDLNSALIEMKRVLKSNGNVAGYVWDYSEKMEMLRYFWNAAVELNSEAKEYDEGVRFQICNINNLRKELSKAGLINIEVATLDLHTRFQNFDDFWNPFLGEQGPAPAYYSSLSNSSKIELKNKIHYALPIGVDGSIPLIARSIVFKATVG